MGTAREVRREQVEGSARDAIVGGEAMQKDGVVDGIKGGGKIK